MNSELRTELAMRVFILHLDVNMARRIELDVWTLQDIAESSVSCADALLAELGLTEAKPTEAPP